MTKNFQSEPCPMCGVGTWVPHANDVHTFTHKGCNHQVSGLHYALCDKCGTRGYIPGQIAENKRLVGAYQAQLRDYISPSTILALREKYQVTQEQAAKVFGATKNAFSKWERGEVQPTAMAAVFLKSALSDPNLMRKLASEVGVSVQVLGAPTPNTSFEAVSVGSEARVRTLSATIPASFVTGAPGFGAEHHVKVILGIASAAMPMAIDSCLDPAEPKAKVKVPKELVWPKERSRKNRDHS